MRLFLLIYILFAELELIFGCIHSGSIECFCASDVIKCFGSIEDSVQIEQLFSNISLIHSSQYLESLVLNLTNLHSLGDLFLTDFKIKNLTVVNGIQNFSENIFSLSFSELYSLKIQNSEIHYLSNPSFHTLYHLVELRLESNEIFGIEPEAFFNLSSLQLLSVSKNRLSKLDKDFLLHLPLLQTLLLNENNISSVSNVQIQSSSLIELSAQNCYMTGFLEKYSLLGLSNLSYIDFSENQIEGVNSFALSSLLNLKELNLSKNSLQFLEDNAFSALVNLEVLDLSSNKISLIKTTAFNKLSNLLHLDLKRNFFRAMLCDYTFDFNSLRKVDLRENRIKTIGAGTFSYSHNIQELFLEGNALDEPDAIICSPLPNITIMFIDIDFKSKNCEMPDSCGVVLPNIEEDYETDFNVSSNVTTVDLIELITEEMESISYSSINSTNLEDETTTPYVNASLTFTTYSGDWNVTEIYSTPDSFSTQVDKNATNSEKNNFSDTEVGFESTSMSSDRRTSDLTTFLNDSITEQTESSFISTTEKDLKYAKIQFTKETESPLASNATENVLILSSEDTNLTYTGVDTPTVSNKASIYVSNYSFDSKLCFLWTLLNGPSQNHACIEKHDSCSGRGIKYLKCPKSDIFTEDCIENNDILKFCLRLLINNVEIDKTCIQPKPYVTCKNKPSSATKALVSSTEAITVKKDAAITISTLSSSERQPSMSSQIPFRVTSFDVIFNSSYSGVAVWEVNTNKSFETCNLILTLTYVDSHKQELIFMCSNNSYVLKNLDDLQKICLQSKDENSKTETKCMHNFLSKDEANAYKIKDHGYKNSSLFALSILLLVVLALIIFLVLRNLLKKRFDRDRYNVYIEEQNVQKRSSTLYQEPNVRYSYTPKE